jgi:hypothetical protein
MLLFLEKKPLGWVAHSAQKAPALVQEIKHDGSGEQPDAEDRVGLIEQKEVVAKISQGAGLLQNAGAGVAAQGMGTTVSKKFAAILARLLPFTCCDGVTLVLDATVEWTP